MSVFIENGTLLESDCTIIAHQMNCFSVPHTATAKKLEQRHPEVMTADKKFKLPPRERLGRFSFAPVNDRTRLVFHLYGQFRYGQERDYTDFHALKQALENLFKAITIAERKGFPIKVGLPFEIGSKEGDGLSSQMFYYLKSLSSTYEYDVYLYKK